MSIRAAAQDDGWVGRSYQKALAHFAGGQKDVAFDELRLIENREVESGGGDALLGAERKVIAEIAARDAQALPALVLLHHDAFLTYRKSQRLRLAAHALRVIVDTADSSEMRSAEPAVKRVAGLAMTSLAGVVVQLNPPDAIELLRRAIDLDPLNAHALLAIGAIYEKYGSYPEATDALKRCVAIAPSPEARLRLAINLRRTAEAAAAEPLLAELARGGETVEEWVGVLANQELAGLLAEQGRLRDAVARLRDAVQLYPGNGSLRVQLSYLLERAGDPGPALAAAQEAARRVDGTDSTAQQASVLDPRLLYNRWPQHAFDDAAAAMRQAAEPQLPRLALALGAARGADG